MNKVRILGLLLCLILILCACAAPKEAAPQESTTVTIWHYYNNAQLESFQHIVDTFNNTVGLEKNIEVREKSLGYVDDLASAVVKAADNVPGSDPMPDMFVSYSDTAYRMDTMGKVSNLDPYFTPEELDAYHGEFIEEGRFTKDGALKIMPTAKSTEALYINATDFEAFIAENPEISYDNLATIEGILEAAQVYYDWSGGKAFYGRDSLSNYFIIGSRQLGIDLFDYDENGEFFFHADKAVIRKLYDSYYVPMVQGLFCADGKFRSSDLQLGELLCYTGSTSSSAYFPTKVIVSDTESYPIDCKVLPAPVFADAELAYTVSQGAGIVVTAGEPDKIAACVTFLKWFTEGENSVVFSSGSSYLPVKKAQLNSTILDSTDNPAEKQAFAVGLQAVEQNLFYTNAASLYGNDIRNVLDKSLNTLARTSLAELTLLMDDGMSREEAIAQLTQDSVFEAWYTAFLKEIEDSYRK